MELVNLVKMDSKKLALRVNASKTKVMMVDIYEKVNAFIYLGSIITE